MSKRNLQAAETLDGDNEDNDRNKSKLNESRSSTSSRRSRKIQGYGVQFDDDEDSISYTTATKKTNQGGLLGVVGSAAANQQKYLPGALKVKDSDE